MTDPLDLFSASQLEVPQVQEAPNHPQIRAQVQAEEQRRSTSEREHSETLPPESGIVTSEIPESKTPVAVIHPKQWRLSRIQLVNWGVFDGYHDLPVPRAGMLVTGENGSGKSSLLDALSTVLVPPARVRFNVAADDSIGGDTSRSLYSYVRGAYRNQADESSGEIRLDAIRSGRSIWAGVLLSFNNGTGETISAGQLFFLPSSGGATSDVRRRFIFLNDELDLLDVEPFVRDRLDSRRLRQNLGILADEKYPNFGQRLRRRLGIGSEQSQLLLHRVQSAKNLGSLDGLLREFMLETPPTFKMADRAVEEFANLSDAHAAVVDAREQEACLLPLREAWKTRSDSQKQLEFWQQTLRHLPPFMANLELELLTKKHANTKLTARKPVTRSPKKNRFWKKPVFG